MARLYVTVPLQLSASIGFDVEDGAEVTPEMIAEKLADAQRVIDRRGSDSETGIYFTIDGHGTPSFDDLDA